MRTTAGTWILPVLGLCLSACGSSNAPTAESPRASSSKQPSPVKTDAAKVDDARTSSGASNGQSEKGAKTAKAGTNLEHTEAGDGLRKASRPPAELITGPNVVYVYNFKDSAAGTAAKERCEQEKPDDPAAMRACVAAARSKVPVESIRFMKTNGGEYWWITYNRYKGNLLKWNRIQFLPGKETESSIALTLIGKDKGIAPMPRVPASLSIELPNDYSIVVHHPAHGAMVYDAKIGLMEAESP